MSCSLTLYEDPNYGGDQTNRTTTFTSNDDGENSSNMRRIQDRDSSAKVSGPCAWVVMQHPKSKGGGGFVLDPNENAPNLRDSNHHGEGKGSTNHRWYKRGDEVGRVVKIVPPTDGYYDDINIYAKRSDSLGQWGHFPWVTDALLNNPNDSQQLITSATDKGQPCPGAEKATIIGHRSYRCTYKTEGQITNLKTGTRATGDPRRAMFNNIYDKFCNNSDNAFTKPGGQLCIERSTGIAIAKTYCSKGDNIKSDANCTKESLNKANYDSLAAAYCESNPNDSFCSCYNVVKDKCADDKKTGVKGCAATSEYVDLRNATPSEFRSVWNGQRKCGSICTGGDKYIPDNNQAGCKTTIQICAQDINVGSMSESDIKASCELNASDGSSAGEPPAPSPAQESAQSEVEEAKAALARGDPGAQEKLDAAEAALDTAGETGPKAYIPKSLDGLKNNRKQQIGAGAMGALVLGCILIIVMIAVSSSGGGGGKKRFR
jgi:hypothetical protein